MSTTTLVTADELLALPTGAGKRYELVAGELRVMSPSGWLHGTVGNRLQSRLDRFVELHDLGLIFGAETGFRLATNPDTVRAPDIAFVAKKNIPANLSREGFWPGHPDLAVEVLSPGDRAGEIDEKIEAWLDAGCLSVWIVNPKLQTVTIYHASNQVEVKTANDMLVDDTVVSGFSCSVSELFR